MSFRIRIIGAISIAVCASAVNAAPQPQAIDLGPGKLIPTLNISHKNDDNIFSQRNNEKSSGITQLQPTLQFLAQKDDDTYAVTYTGDYGSYSGSNDDDYDDHTLSFDAIMKPADLYSIDFGASTAKKHDNRGEGSSEGVIATTRRAPDEYDISEVNVLFDFGRSSAKFGIEAEATRTDIEYTNNRTETQFRDRVDLALAGRFYGKVSDKTRYFVEYQNEDFDYSATPTLGGILNSQQTSISVGAEWEATGKTTGSVKIGRLEKDFDNSSLKDSDITVWDLGIVWSPRSYSHFSFSAAKGAKETNGTGSFIESQDLGVAWIHNWTDRMNTVVSVGTGEDEYEDSTRSDDRDSYGVALNYDWRRWATVGLNYSYTDRDSNDARFDYDKNVFMVQFLLSL